MNKSIYQFTLDIHSAASQISLPVLLGDTGRQLRISLAERGASYEIADGCRAVFFATKADGVPLANDCVILNNRIIQYDFTNQTANVEGLADCEIRLYGADGKKITAPRFAMIVDSRVVYNEDIPVSEVERTTIDNMISAETARVAAELIRIAAEEDRVEEEAKRSKGEVDRTANESVRTAEEEKRKEAESARETEEANRREAENTRATSENNRATKESARVLAEKSRVDAEKERHAGEQARAEAEQLRALAEASRFEEENFRCYHETERISAETERRKSELNRIGTENERAESELQRVDAETARGENEKERLTAELDRSVAEKERAAAEVERDKQFNHAISFLDDAKKLFSNAVNSSAKGEVVALKDVSPIEHGMSVRVRSKNLIDPAKFITACYRTTLNGDVFTSIFEVNTMYFNSYKMHPFKAGTYTALVVPMSKDMYFTFSIYSAIETTKILFSATKEKANNLFYYTFTAKEDFLVCLGGHMCDEKVSNNEGDGTFSYKIQLIEGNAITSYAPFAYEATADISEAGKNLLPYPYYTAPTTVGGLIATEESGIVTLSGTYTSSVLADYGLASKLYLPVGTYTVSGCPKDGTSSTYRIMVWIKNRNTDVSRYAGDYGAGVTFTLAAGEYIELIAIRVSTGWESGSTQVFTPKLERKVVYVRQYGKNLFPVESITTAENGAGEVALDIKKHGTYTLSCDVTKYADDTATNTRTTIMAVYADGTQDEVDSIADTTNAQRDGGSRHRSVTITTNAKKVLSSIRVLTLNYSDHAGRNAKAEKIQLEYSATETEYEPYREPVTYPVSADGVESKAHIYPTTTLLTDTDNVLLDVTYNCDLNIVLSQLVTRLEAIEAAVID